MKVFDPKIPYQINSWDCGFNVCRYAYAMNRLRERPFTYYPDVMYFDMPNAKQPYLMSLITEQAAFQFGAKDILRIRSEFTQLLERLCKMDDDQKRSRSLLLEESGSRQVICFYTYLGFVTGLAIYSM
jgi:hypothetical protein